MLPLDATYLHVGAQLDFWRVRLVVLGNRMLPLYAISCRGVAQRDYTQDRKYYSLRGSGIYRVLLNSEKLPLFVISCREGAQMISGWGPGRNNSSESYICLVW